MPNRFDEIRESLDKHELYENQIILQGLFVWVCMGEPKEEEDDVQE